MNMHIQFVLADDFDYSQYIDNYIRTDIMGYSNNCVVWKGKNMRK